MLNSEHKWCLSGFSSSCIHCFLNTSFFRCQFTKNSRKIIFRATKSFPMTPWMPRMDSADNFGPIWFFFDFLLWSSKQNWSSKQDFGDVAIYFCWHEQVRKLSQGVQRPQSGRYATYFITDKKVGNGQNWGGCGYIRRVRETWCTCPILKSKTVSESPAYELSLCVGLVCFLTLVRRAVFYFLKISLVKPLKLSGPGIKG